jgi:hypothetical protein
MWICSYMYASVDYWSKPYIKYVHNRSSKIRHIPGNERQRVKVFYRGPGYRGDATNVGLSWKGGKKAGWVGFKKVSVNWAVTFNDFPGCVYRRTSLATRTVYCGPSVKRAKTSFEY